MSEMWNGFPTEKFLFEGHECTVVVPENKRSDGKWVWRAEFFGAFARADVEMAKQGCVIAYVSLSNRYGCPSAVRDMESFRQMLVKKYGLCEKAMIFGFSRGALYAVNYAVAYPKYVDKLYLDAPVLDISSWPGGKGIGVGSPECWEECLNIYTLSEATAKLFRGNPIDNVRSVAAAKIPVLIVAGGSDKTVPYCENGEIFAARLRECGGEVVTIIKPGCDHHPHSLEDPKPIVDFLLR